MDELDNVCDGGGVTTRIEIEQAMTAAARTLRAAAAAALLAGLDEDDIDRLIALGVRDAHEQTPLMLRRAQENAAGMDFHPDGADPVLAALPRRPSPFSDAGFPGLRIAA